MMECLIPLARGSEMAGFLPVPSTKTLLCGWNVLVRMRHYLGMRALGNAVMPQNASKASLHALSAPSELARLQRARAGATRTGHSVTWRVAQVAPVLSLRWTML
jgi:hypothetical protein